MQDEADQGLLQRVPAWVVACSLQTPPHAQCCSWTVCAAARGSRNTAWPQHIYVAKGQEACYSSER